MNLKPSLTPGLMGWGAVFTTVALWDILAPETLSHYARSHPFLTWVAGGTIMGHLLHLLPPSLDPIDLIGKVLSPASIHKPYNDPPKCWNCRLQETITA